MKVGYKVLVIKDYYHDEDWLNEKLLAPKGSHLTVNKFSKKDWKYNRCNCGVGEGWYLAFDEIEGCYSFPNDYMEYDTMFNRINEIDNIIK